MGVQGGRHLSEIGKISLNNDEKKLCLERVFSGVNCSLYGCRPNKYSIFSKDKLYRETWLIDHYMGANYIVYKSIILPLLTQ